MIQDHSDPGASKEPLNPCPEWLIFSIGKLMFLKLAHKLLKFVLVNICFTEDHRICTGNYLYTKSRRTKFRFCEATFGAHPDMQKKVASVMCSYSVVFDVC